MLMQYVDTLDRPEAAFFIKTHRGNVGYLCTDAQHVVFTNRIGNNHEGDCTLAEELIKRAADAGADAVKFQTFRTEHYVSRSNPERFNRLAITIGTRGRWRGSGSQRSIRRSRRDSRDCGKRIFLFTIPFGRTCADGDRQPD